MNIWISEMNYTLFDGFPELLNADCMPPSFKLDQADGDFLHEPHLVFRTDTINLSLGLIYKEVHLSHTPGGGFNLSIRQTDLRLHTLVSGHVYRPVNLFVCSSLNWSKFFFANMLLEPIALVPTSCNSCRWWCWNTLSKSLCLAGVTWWISCFNRSIARRQSAYDHMVAACQALFGRTWNCCRFDVVPCSAPYTWNSIAVWILWIFCLRNWWDSIAKCSSTFAFADFYIIWFRKAPFFFVKSLQCIIQCWEG